MVEFVRELINLVMLIEDPDERTEMLREARRKIQAEAEADRADESIGRAAKSLDEILDAVQRGVKELHEAEINLDGRKVSAIETGMKEMRRGR